MSSGIGQFCCQNPALQQQNARQRLLQPGMPAAPVQVWVFRNAALKCLCIAFRGTEQIKWKDLLTGELLSSHKESVFDNPSLPPHSLHCECR